MNMQNDEAFDWVNWDSFFIMLSAKRLEPFLSELRLPFDRVDFPAIMRLARACLEVKTFVSLGRSIPEVAGPNLDRVWREYRASDRVLPDRQLACLAAKYPEAQDQGKNLFEELSVNIGTELAGDLEHWYWNDFRAESDIRTNWPFALRFLLQRITDRSVLSTPDPLNTEALKSVERFVRDFYAMSDSLDMRFRIISTVAEAHTPTSWEAVLQAFPAEGIGNRYPWPGYIQQCFEYKFLRTGWGELRKKLGDEPLQDLVEWARHNEALLPNYIVLPSPPPIWEKSRKPL